MFKSNTKRSFAPKMNLFPALICHICLLVQELVPSRPTRFSNCDRGHTMCCITSEAEPFKYFLVCLLSLLRALTDLVQHVKEFTSSFVSIFLSTHGSIADLKSSKNVSFPKTVCIQICERNVMLSRYRLTAITMIL